MHELNYNKTIFLKSCSTINEIEIKNGIEVAFVGYSNSGKSSAINFLTNQKKLARCSKMPGRTQLVNFFKVSSSFRIVDLPGYGYSKAPILVKKKWQNTIYDYLTKRKQLKALVLLMDIRYPLKKLDEEIVDIAIRQNLSILILLTKCDKISVNQQKKQLEKVSNKLNLLFNFFEIECFSSLKKIGIEKLKLKLNNWYHEHNIL